MSINLSQVAEGVWSSGKLNLTGPFGMDFACDGGQIELIISDISSSQLTNSSTFTWTLNFKNAVPWSTGATTNNLRIMYTRPPATGAWREAYEAEDYTIAGTYSFTGTLTIPHEDDGTCPDWGFKIQTSSNRYLWRDVEEMTYEFTFDTIMLASTITVSNGTIGQPIRIYIAKIPGADYTDTLTYQFGNATGTIVTKTSQTTVTWTPPLSLAAQIPTEMSGTCTITCSTYNGNSLNGTSTATCILSVPDTDAPYIEVDVHDTNTATTTLTGDNSRLIKFFSTAYAEIQATSNTGANIVRTEIVYGGITYYGASGFYSYTFPNAETNTFTFRATDSRGKVTSQTITVPMTDYIKLTTNVEAERPDIDGNMQIHIYGNYYNGSFGAYSNTLTLRYRYVVSGGTMPAWTTVTPTFSGSTYTCDITVSGLVYQNKYDIEVSAIDRLMTLSAEATTLTASIFDWSENDFNFNVPVTFSAGASGLDKGVLYGTCDTPSTTAEKLVTCDSFQEAQIGTNIRVKFQYANGASAPSLNINGLGGIAIKRDSSDNMTSFWVANEIVDFIYDGTNWVIVRDSVKSGIWYPTLTNISAYTGRGGWYQKIGNVVTVGFYISGTFSSSASTSTQISITGLPYANGAQPAFGGGICYNCYVPTGALFVGWGVGASSSAITGRVATLRTSAGGLILNSNLFQYPSQTFTVSGTVCYSIV